MIDTELFSALETLTDKLADLMEKNEWSHQIESEEYPIVFRFRRGLNAFDFEREEDQPEIELCFRERTYVSVVPERTVDEKFLNKLKNLCKEICRVYLLLQFSRKDDRFNRAITELWTTARGHRVVILSKTYKP